MITIKRLQSALSKFDTGDRSEATQKTIFKAVAQTIAGDEDIAEMEDIDEAVDYLKRRLQHGHYRS